MTTTSRRTDGRARSRSSGLAGWPVPAISLSSLAEGMGLPFTTAAFWAIAGRLPAASTAARLNERTVVFMESGLRVAGSVA
ncbi:hypothetical protein D3C71_1985440 [compost metagenome]